MKMTVVLLFVIGVFLFFRSDSLSIHGPLFEAPSEAAGSEALDALSQPYQFLGKGKQAFAFESADGKWVVKFFNQRYHKLPFWAALIPSERSKREKRKRFYLESYRIASAQLREETAIAYLHLGPSPARLPHLDVVDARGKKRRIDLNGIPFVLQRKATPLYSALQSLPEEARNEAIGQFVSLVALRIERKIRDGDHEVEDNYGYLSGRVVQIDPGRLYLEERLWEPETLRYEWWSATHRLRKWLEKNDPERVNLLDSEIETNLQRVLQPSPTSPSPQRDGLLLEQFQAS